MNPINPDSAFAALMAKPGRSERRRALTAIHEACCALFGAKRQISVTTVGRHCEEQGIMRARALYNKQSADYRALIVRGHRLLRRVGPQKRISKQGSPPGGRQAPKMP